MIQSIADEEDQDEPIGMPPKIHDTTSRCHSWHAADPHIKPPPALHLPRLTILSAPAPFHQISPPILVHIALFSQRPFIFLPRFVLASLILVVY